MERFLIPQTPFEMTELSFGLSSKLTEFSFWALFEMTDPTRYRVKL